jgi:hypothetical protein
VNQEQKQITESDVEPGRAAESGATLAAANSVAVERRSASSVRQKTSLDAYMARRANGSGITADWGWSPWDDGSLLAMSDFLTATSPGLRNIGPDYRPARYG